MRDFEAQVLVDLVRLSRLTLLYGGARAGKTTLLKTGVLPLLRRRTDDRRFPHHAKPRVVVPFPDRRKNEPIVRGADIALVFDRWDDEPLTALRKQILDTLGSEGARMAQPPSLSDAVAAWNAEFGVRFFIILDCFEEYLRAPLDRPGIAEFDDEFVRAMNAPRLPAHFLLSVRDDAEALLNRYRGRIHGFGDAFLRLPRIDHVTEPALVPSSGSGEPSSSSTISASGMAPAPVPMALRENASYPGATQAAIADPAINAPAPVQASQETPAISSNLCVLVQPHGRNKRGRLTLVPNDRQARSGDAVPGTDSPHPALSPHRISLAAIIAGFVIGAGAGYFAIYGYHSLSPGQAASSPTLPAPVTVENLDLSIPETPVAPEVLPPTPPPKRVRPAPRSASPPPAPVPVENARASAPSPKVATRIEAPQAPAVMADWQTAMRRELEVCGQERFFARVLCTEKVRWRHCAPHRWNTVPECVAGTTQATRSD